MKLGLLGMGGSNIEAIQHAESLGYDSVWTAGHVDIVEDRKNQRGHRHHANAGAYASDGRHDRDESGRVI